MGPRWERDLCITRAVLQLAALQNLRDANILFEAFQQRMKISQMEIDSPLTTFIGYLLQTLLRDAAPLFRVLVERYGQALDRDPNFQQYLALIGQKFYGIEPPQNGMGAMLNQMMSMFG